MAPRREKPIKRLAILIGNDKWGGDLLPGVTHDMDAMSSFLQSPAGGAWNPNQMFIIVRPIGRDSFLNLLRKAVEEGYEYFFIYFGGHGELSRAGFPLMVLPGGEEIGIPAIRQILISKPVLMITDSCQGIPEYSQGGTLRESRKMFSSGDAVWEFKAARLFDDALRRLPPMFTHASAVSYGQEAKDSDSGGLYTQSLMLACENILDSDNPPGVYGICGPHMIATRLVLSRSHGKQKPAISGYSRSFQPPFLVKL